MLNLRGLIVATLATATMFCLLAALVSARKGRTYHALAFLVIASVPFLVAAIRADSQRPAARPPIMDQQQLMQNCWRGSARSDEPCPVARLK